MELNAAAHAAGDLYYRSLTIESRCDGGISEECAALGEDYERALENLRSHLLTLQFNGEVDDLLQATERYLSFIRKDQRRS